MAKTWTIGSHPGSDLVASRPASERHCRLTVGPGGAILEDLGSSEGTFVNRVRITGPILVSRSDSITLGPTAPMPWPPAVAESGPVVLRIGREPDNDLVVDRPTVSGHHARVTWSGRPGEAVIEDLNSSNGTALGSPDRKVNRSTFTAADTIYLGTEALSAASVLARLDPSIARVLTPRASGVVIGRAPECDQVVDEPSVSWRHARLTTSGGRLTLEDLGSSNGTFVNGRRIEGPTAVEPGDIIGLGLSMTRIAAGPPPTAAYGARTIVEPIARPTPTIELSKPAPTPEEPSGISWPVGLLSGLLVQGPIAALVILGAVGSGFSRPEAVAPLAFGLGLSAVWFGLSDAVILGLLWPSTAGGNSTPARLGGIALVCLGQCLLAWGIVARLAGLRGPGIAALGLLFLAAMVGAALGLLVLAAAPRRRRGLAWAALPLALVGFWLFGGGPRALPRSDPMVGTISGLAPSRWAFEGLLLMESGPAGPSPDLAEPYFPAETDRMGPRADALALVAMLVGLSASAAFFTKISASGP